MVDIRLWALACIDTALRRQSTSKPAGLIQCGMLWEVNKDAVEILQSPIVWVAIQLLFRGSGNDSTLSAGFFFWRDLEPRLGARPYRDAQAPLRMLVWNIGS